LPFLDLQMNSENHLTALKFLPRYNLAIKKSQIMD